MMIGCNYSLTLSPFLWMTCTTFHIIIFIYHTQRQGRGCDEEEEGVCVFAHYNAKDHKVMSWVCVLLPIKDFSRRNEGTNTDTHSQPYL